MHSFSFRKFLFWLVVLSSPLVALFVAFLASGAASEPLHTAQNPPAKSAPAAEPTDSAHVRWDACYEAHNHIKAVLKAPATAEFPNCYRQDDLVSTKPVDGKPGSYAVTTYVDAQNSFGADIRSYFMCPVWFPDADHVKVQCLETDASHTKTLEVF